MEDLAQASFDSPIQRPDEKPKIPGPHRSMDLHSREAPGTHHSATVGVVDRERIQDVENRKWCPPRGTEDILIHAGLDNCDLSEERLQEIEEEHGVKLPREFEQGGIVGVVAVQACAIWSHSPLHESGSNGWMLVRPRRLRFRKCQGQVKLFRPALD